MRTQKTHEQWLRDRQKAETKRLLNKTRMQARLLEQRDADATALAKAREAFAAPSKWGHSDLGDMLLRYLAGEATLAYFLWFADVTYLGVTGVPAPTEEPEKEDEA